MKRLLALALAAAAVVAPGAATPASDPTLVFTGDRGEGNHLFLVRSNGTKRQQLTSGPAFEVAPAWNREHSQIAFSSTLGSGTVAQQDIYVVRRDGSELRAIVETGRNETSPSWSPDGRSIVFERDTTGRGGYDLYIANVATGRMRRLTTGSAIEAVPAWSPDGKWIAYSRAGQIWLIRPDGRQAHGLGKTGVGVDWAPDWSPDGRRIAFESTSRTSLSNPVSQVWVMRADGSGKRRLSPYARKRPIASNGPAWSPGGALIAFTRGTQVWTMRPDGSRLRQLTRAPGAAWGADW
jgi:TolB protein